MSKIVHGKTIKKGSNGVRKIGGRSANKKRQGGKEKVEGGDLWGKRIGQQEVIMRKERTVGESVGRAGGSGQQSTWATEYKVRQQRRKQEKGGHLAPFKREIPSGTQKSTEKQKVDKV